MPLNLSTEMYFRDGRAPQRFDAALLELSQAIGMNEEVSNSTFDAVIVHMGAALKNEALALNQGATDPESRQKIVAFHRWAMNIHNDQLAAPPGLRFPNNIVYQFISEMRTRNNAAPLTAEESLFHFFLEALNARKISKGHTPPVRFMSTSIMLMQLQHLVQQPQLSPAAAIFWIKYADVSKYSKAQAALESTVTTLKNDPVFSDLSKALDFSRKTNEETGANAYDLESARQQGIALLSHQHHDAIAQMTQTVADALRNASKEFADVSQVSEPARRLALWDASEWLCRMIVALQITAAVAPQHQSTLDEIMKDAFVAEVYKRSMIGDFPATARDNDIQAIEISELFFQASIAQEAAASVEAKKALCM